MNADLRGQKPMRRFRSPQGPALRAGQFSAAALWQAPCGKGMKGMRNRAFATMPPQKTSSEAPHRLLLADPRRTNPRLSALLSAFLSVSKYRTVKLFVSPGRAGIYQCNYLPLQPIAFGIGVRRRFSAPVSVKGSWSCQTLPVPGEAEGLPMDLSEMQDRILDFQDSLDVESFSLFLPDESSIKRMDGFHVSQKVGLAQGCGRLAA